MGTQSLNEALLHWVWKNQQFKKPLQTTGGDEITVHHPGRHNTTDGPDFTNAEVRIGPLRWYGDVEIHWKPGDWYRHGHHNDSNYNGVILHIVYETESEKNDKPALPTFCIKPFLSQPLSVFLESVKNSSGLPCSKNVSYISPGALEAQIAKAHRQYFDQKVDKLLHFYDPELPPSKAWQKMLIVALFDGLGIAFNREPMRKLAQGLLDEYQRSSSLNSFKKEANKEAFNGKNYQWKRKGSRPANHPAIRIEQGSELIWYMLQQPFKYWFNFNIKSIFNECIKSIGCKPKVGKKRAGILYGVVWLPGIYLLGDLFGSDKLATAARHAWMEHRTALPESIRRPFREAGIPEFVYRQKLGTVHQFKRYCRGRQCHKCEVFKHTIHA